MTIYVSLGKDCSVGWNIKEYIGQKYLPFDFVRIYDIEWILEWIIHGMDLEEFFEGIEFIRESDKFNSRIYKTSRLGFFHDFYSEITMEEVKDKYKRRIERLKTIISEPQLEYIHFIRNGIPPKNLKKFEEFLKTKEIPYKFTITNWKNKEDWKIRDKPWSDIFGLTHYRNFVEQATDSKIDTTLWRYELIEYFEKIKNNSGNYKMYYDDNSRGVMVAQINPYQITHYYTRLYPLREIEIKVSPGGFAQSNIPIANELYTFVANYVKGKELVTIYGRNSHHFIAFMSDLVKECKGYSPCPICVKDSNNSVILSSSPELEGFGIISPGRQGLKFEVKLKEYLYISCSEKTAIRDLYGKNYKKIKEFNLFPGTKYTEQVFLICP